MGSNINEYKNLLLVKVDEYDADVDWISYKLENRDMRLYIENNKFVSVACYDECIFKGKNLIGLNINELNKFLNKKPDKSEKMMLDSGLKEVYDYYNLGIQVYVKAGIVDSITCSIE